MTRILLVTLVLGFAVGTVRPGFAQPASSATIDTLAVVDSLHAALARFERASPPTASDTAALHRWADSLQATGNALRGRTPARARALLEEVLVARRAVSDSAGTAAVIGDLGVTHYFQSQYEAALDRFREALRRSREVDARSEASNNLNNIANILDHQGRYGEALAHYRKALSIYDEMENQRGVARALANIGGIHFSQSRYETALEKYRESLSIKRRLGDRRTIALTLNNVGLIHRIQSRYEEALAQYRESLAIFRELGSPRGTATTLTNIGIVHEHRGRYEEALANIREAFTIFRDVGDQRGMAASQGQMGSIHFSEGRYEDALHSHRRALALFRKIGYQPGVARATKNVGVVQYRWGRYEQALSTFRQSLEINRELGNRDGIASSLSNIGDVYVRQGRRAEALAEYRKSLSIRRELGDRDGVAAALSDIGRLYWKKNRPGTALRRFRAALSINQEIGRRPRVAGNLARVGRVHLERGHLQAATDTLSIAVALAEELRQHASSPEARRTLLSTQIGAYRALTWAYVRSGRPDSALRSVEEARARLLAERLRGSVQGHTSSPVPSPAELRHSLSRNEAALLYANPGANEPLTALVVTRDTTIARLLPDSTVRAEIEHAYPTRLTRLRRTEGPLTAALGPHNAGGHPELPSLAEAIHLYRYYLVRGETADPAIQGDLAQRLYGLLVAPVADELADRESLTIIPTGALGYLPIETLKDSTGTYLVERTDVRYAQSLTVLGQLQERDYGRRTRSLLALGGVAYEPTESDGSDQSSLVAKARRGSTRVSTPTHATTLLRAAERRRDGGRSPRPSYEQLGYARWSDLPGTKKEAVTLGEIANAGSTVITDRAASEDTIRALSRRGQLGQYRRVHFATHGIAVPETPRLSALVLSQVGASDSLAARDGFLTMREIPTLTLRADVAVLSACQTGLGRIIAGEGVVSLSHAFLRAGANATLVSQWKVLDRSTRQFMTGVYRRANADETSFAEAVTETKRAFIEGEYGAKNADPLRWAPFVYYGRR